MARKTVIGLCLGVSGLAVLVWPLVFFGSIFLFDAPTWRPGGEFGRWLTFLTLNSYPLTFALALAFLWRKLKKDRLEWWHSILASAAALQLLTPIALAHVHEVSTRDDDLQLSHEYVLEKRGSFKRIVRVRHVDGEEARIEVVPIQVRSFEKRGDLIFVRHVKAERWGESGIVTHEQKVSFWVIHLSEGQRFGPFSEAELKAAYELEPESPVFRRTFE